MSRVATVATPTLDQRTGVGEQLDLFAPLPRSTPAWVARREETATAGVPDREGETP